MSMYSALNKLSEYIYFNISKLFSISLICPYLVSISYLVTIEKLGIAELMESINILITNLLRRTAGKVSVFGVILACSFPHLDWILRDTPYLRIFPLGEMTNDFSAKSRQNYFATTLYFSHETKVFS